MPEMLTKYPNSALKILKDAKIKCGAGEKQQILTWCPKENFCALPTGEICVYSVRNMSQMMQINAFDLFFSHTVFMPLLALLVITFALGTLFGNKIAVRKKRKLD